MLTAVQKAGVEAAILEYLAAEGGRFARTLAAFQEEVQLPSPPQPEDAQPTVFETLVDYGLQCGYHFQAAIDGDNHDLVRRLSRVFVAFKFDDDEVQEATDYRLPLSLACDTNKMDMVEIMLDSGMDPNELFSEGENGKSPLHRAQTVDIAKLLVEHGAVKERKLGGSNYGEDHDNRRPIGVAVEHNYVGVVEYLLDQGCDRDRVDSDNGWTYLHTAAHCGHLEVAELLMRYGIALDVRDNEGKTPTDLARDQQEEHPNARDEHAFRPWNAPDHRPRCLAVIRAIEAEFFRRRDHGFKRDRSTIPGTEEYEAAKRPRVEEEAKQEEEDDDDDDDDDDEDDDAA